MSLVSSDATGLAFYSGIISAVGADASYLTANIAPVGASLTTAIAGNYGLTGGGEVLRTTNAGTSWTKVLTFATAGSFLDFVHMFDALKGVAVGDPTLGYFEIYMTSDGGITWNRVPQANIPPAANANEAGQLLSFFALPNGTLWFGASSSNSANPVRVFKSIDYGLHWTVSTSTTLTGNNINHLAFKNAMDGIAYNYTFNTIASGVQVIAAVNLVRTSDGGNIWVPITPSRAVPGSFFYSDIDAVNGFYYSTGTRFPQLSPAVAADFGFSYSTDGINWINLETGRGQSTFDLVNSGLTIAAGYAIGDATTSNPIGMYKTGGIFTATHSSALQSALKVYPNPSASGLFSVALDADLKSSAMLTVIDALGRQVKSQKLNAAASGAKDFNLDLSSEKAGVYTLQIRTDAGIATQKVVIE